MKRIILLGATGSIGRSTLDVIRSHRDRFELVGLTAHTNEQALEKIAAEFEVDKTALTGADDDGKTSSTDVNMPFDGSACRLVRDTDADVVVNGIAGASGLAPSISALETGKDLALANKETVVMAGDLIQSLAESTGQLLLPVDSEHAALFYLLEGVPRKRISRLVLTASGGAFRDTAVEDLPHVTVTQALAHPTWDMGHKITIDSATMANKGLEIIEAVRLFGVPEESIDVYIHRQSTIHAMVQTTDGSFYAQLSDPDMRVPIQHALSYPDEYPCAWGHVDLAGLILSFETPDSSKYPALSLAREAIRAGGEYPIAFNASNEVAVDAFVAGRLTFTGISQVISECLAATWKILLTSFEQVYEADSRAREITEKLVTQSATGHTAGQTATR